MIIPVVFSLSPSHGGLMYTWWFNKGLDLACTNGWAVLAQRQYWEDKQGQEALGASRFAEDFDYCPVSPEQEAACPRGVFPEELIAAYTARFPSETDAYLHSISDPWPEMEQWLVQTVRALEEQCGEKAEAFLCITGTRFVRDAAEKLGIPVMHFELSSFRGSMYRHTAYLDMKGSVCEGEMADRYARFMAEEGDVPILSGREILALFLQDGSLAELDKLDTVTPVYEAGLALGYNVPHVFTHLNQMTSTEALYKLSSLFTSEQIAVRYHPGDPVQGRLRGVQVPECSLPEFILQSRRLVCISSNIAYEAMLWGRPGYDLGASQYGQFANHTLEGLRDHMADDSFLSFVALSYCIPYELLKSAAYLRWRLQGPTEKELYLFHLRYYLRCLMLDEAILRMQGGSRFEAILKARKDTAEKLMNEENIRLSGDEKDIATVFARYEQQRNLQQKATQENRVLKAENDELKRAYGEINYQKELARQEADSLRKADDQLRRADAELQDEMYELRRRQERLYETVNDLHVQIADALRHLQAAEKQREQAEAQNAALQRTLSWRITAPLRAVRRLLGKLLHR